MDKSGQQINTAGVLYVVATPIGNLDDISTRAAAVLSDVDMIAAEDTRHSRNLLKHLHIKARMLAYHDHSADDAQDLILNPLHDGKSVALISDAGTPLISDPGFKLVRAARIAGIKVIPIPGPAALVAALSVAGIPTDRFTFLGFPPAKPAARRALLAELTERQETLVFYESSHRIVATVESMVEVFGARRQVFVGRELTKLFESHFFGALDECSGWLRGDDNERRGEFVIVLSGFAGPAIIEEMKAALGVFRVLRDELPLKQAVTLASRISGVRKNALYQAALEEDDNPA